MKSATDPEVSSPSLPDIPMAAAGRVVAMERISIGSSSGKAACIDLISENMFRS
jgi:hypothetical protein